MQEPDKDFTDLAKRYGSRATRDIWRALAGATRDLARTIRKLKLKCDLRQRDSVYLTLDPDGITELRNEFRKRKRARLPGRWLTAAALYRMTGIRGQAAIVTPGNAEIDPMRACRGFLKAAITRGAKVFERSPARRISPSQKGVSVRTPGGVVHAGCVIVATGYATREFKPLVGRFRMKDTYVIATRRLPEPLRRKVTRSHAMVWDTDRPYHYTRWTDDGRLLIGGEDTIHRGIRGSQTRITNARSRLLSYLLRMHPELAAEQAFALP